MSYRFHRHVPHRFHPHASYRLLRWIIFFIRPTDLVRLLLYKRCSVTWIQEHICSNLPTGKRYRSYTNRKIRDNRAYEKKNDQIVDFSRVGIPIEERNYGKWMIKKSIEIWKKPRKIASEKIVGKWATRGNRSYSNLDRTKIEKKKRKYSSIDRPKLCV